MGVGGWRLGGPLGLTLRAVLNKKKKSRPLRTALGAGPWFPLPEEGLAAWAPPSEPPHPHSHQKIFPQEKNEIYQRGLKLDVDFR